MKLRILADDLTGALDSAAAFAGEVPVHLDAPSGGDDPAPVSVVATATRDVAPDALPSMLEPSLDWLRGADVAFKKVDSLLRGNTYAECAWLARQGGFERIVFAPAFPKQGRSTVDWRAWVTQPGSSLPQPIGERSIADAFAGLDPPEVWVPDVRSDDDLRRVAALSTRGSSRRWLWCGSAGLAQAFASVHGIQARVEAFAPAALPLMLVSASHHAVVRRQWVRLEAAAPSLPGLVTFDLSPAERLSPEQAAALLARQAEAIARHDPEPATLIVVGGDTLRALCRATAAQSLRARASPRPGWGRARWVGGRWDGVDCHSRSGAFGADDDLLSIARELLNS
jgi:uncharacterized protein YgbK (DUF1537 family)